MRLLQTGIGIPTGKGWVCLQTKTKAVLQPQRALRQLETETVVLRARIRGELWPKGTLAQTVTLSTAQARQEMPLGVGRSLQPFLFMFLIRIVCAQLPYTVRYLLSTTGHRLWLVPFPYNIESAASTKRYSGVAHRVGTVRDTRTSNCFRARRSACTELT